MSKCGILISLEILWILFSNVEQIERFSVDLHVQYEVIQTPYFTSGR